MLRSRAACTCRDVQDPHGHRDGALERDGLGRAVRAATDEGAQRVEHAPHRNTQAVGHLGWRKPVAAPAREDCTELGVAHLGLAELDPPATAEDCSLAQQIHAAELADVVAIRNRDSPRDKLLATWQHAPSVGSERDVPGRRRLRGEGVESRCSSSETCSHPRIRSR
jgi:hypothetical protein